MKKKIISFLILLFLFSCGYEPKYSLKNRADYDFTISKLSFIGDRQVNLKIKQRLTNYTSVEKEKSFLLKINSISEKIIIAKNSSGDATNFKNTITINVEVFMDNQPKNKFLIIENFNYSNNSNTFELKRYENEIKNNLTEAATDKIIFKLSNIQ